MTKTRSHARELFYYSQLLFIIFIVFAILIQHLNSHEHHALKVQLSSTFSEPRKEKTDSSNGNNNALSAQDYHHQYQLQQSQLQQQHHQQSSQLPQVQQPNNGDSQHHKPERPNSFGPKINKRVFYHDTCKLTTRSIKIIAINSSTGRVTRFCFFSFRHYRQPTAR